MISRRTRMLRWRFDYSDGRVSAYGEWNDDSEGKAALTNKTNLRRAAVEAYDPSASAGIYVAAECDGHDFVNFGWLAIISRRGQRTLGLELKTRDNIIEIFFDGSKSSRPREEADKAFHYAGFGR